MNGLPTAHYRHPVAGAGNNFRQCVYKLQMSHIACGAQVNQQPRGIID